MNINLNDDHPLAVRFRNIRCLLLLQFFADVKEAQDKMKKMQENMKKKYSCDRSTTATRLEDLLQDAVVRTCSHHRTTPTGGSFLSLIVTYFTLLFDRRRKNS